METLIPQMVTLPGAQESDTIHVMAATHTTVDRHKHSFYELVFVREGYCLHHLADSVSLAMEGDILLIKPGVAHRYAGTRECKIFNCLFLQEAFGEEDFSELMKLPGMMQFFSDASVEFPQLHLDLSERKSVSRMLEQMYAECEKREDGWRLRVRSLLICLMIDCSRVFATRGNGHSEKDGYSGYVTHALQYIDEHYAKESLSVKEIGEVVGVSGDYLSRQFRRVTGIAVQEYVRRYRFARAIVCLQQGYTVGDAAKLNGFHSISYFSREFKKEMGMMPSQYLNLQE